MNLTTHIFLERATSGRSVLKPIKENLISLQDEVREAFGWSLDADEHSAQEMANAFSINSPFGHESWNETSRSENLEALKQSIRSARRLVIVGAGSVPIQAVDYPDAWFIAADGAVGAIDDFSRVLCVVSDGDGSDHLERAAQAGVHIVLHAHGDNLDRWKQLASTWSTLQNPPSLTLTHQSKTTYAGMYNPGGFTDGDRALCFIESLGRSLEDTECLGFRTDAVGPWSGVTNRKRKMEKLEWMRESMRRLGVEHFLIR
jgi:uncharacterized Rossmann fold enzyme